MPNTSVHPYSWLARPLCRRYAFAQFRAFDLAMQGPAKSCRWQWAFALFSLGKFEVLGAWQGTSRNSRQIADDLRDRGVERIKLISTDDTSETPLSFSDEDLVDALQTLAGPDDFALPVVIANKFIGRKRRELLSAIAVADRLHTNLERALHRRAPFASDEDALAFIAQWFERANLDLPDDPSPIRPIASRARIVPFIGAGGVSVAVD